jgi:hypothetical protein
MMSMEMNPNNDDVPGGKDELLNEICSIDDNE